MKKICIFTCGGTITMKKNKTGALIPFYKSDVLLEKVPYLKKIAQISIKEVTNIDSTNIGPEIWSKLARMINDNYHLYDGFIVTHGTDTMAYTASALSFALGNLNKPVVFTGSQKPIDDIPTDADNNLINSVIITTYNLTGIYIVFGSKILQGNRTTKTSESSLDAFDSPMVAPIGEITLQPKLNSLYKTDKKDGNEFSLQADFAENVISIILTPGLSLTYLEKLLDNCKGMILSAFGPGNMPTRLLSFLKKAEKLNIPVIIRSQCNKGITQMQLYEVGHQALKYGAIPGNDMTIESAVVKLMWLLAQTRNVDKIRKAFKKNYFGEVTI